MKFHSIKATEVRWKWMLKEWEFSHVSKMHASRINIFSLCDDGFARFFSINTYITLFLFYFLFHCCLGSRCVWFRLHSPFTPSTICHCLKHPYDCKQFSSVWLESLYISYMMLDSLNNKTASNFFDLKIKKFYACVVHTNSIHNEIHLNKEHD